MIFSKDRFDGTYVRKAAPYYRMLPHFMPRINDAVIYYKLQADITGTLALIEAKRAEGRRVTLFHVMVWALLRMGVAHPDLNRFISGRRLYQRRDMSLSFTYANDVDGKSDTFSRIVFVKEDGLDGVSDKIAGTVGRSRAERKDTGKDPLAAFAKLPRWVLAAAFRGLRILDHLGLFTKLLMDLFPSFCSVYAANLGSFGIDAPFHHLFDLGNCSVFVTMGVAHKEWITTEDGKFELRDVCNFAFTIDERVLSGGEAAAAVKMFKSILEHPERKLPEEGEPAR
jgi:hypothetical protein